MYLSFRWYGPEDPISLNQIRQIPGMESVVTALYDVPASQLWPEERLRDYKDQIEAEGMRLDVVESIPVHERIKLGSSDRDEWIAVYCQNIELLGKLGISVLCYNFMPLLNWFRTDLALPMPDGSTALAYDHREVEHMTDPWANDLPAYWPLEDSPEELKDGYRAMTTEDLWENLKYFMEKIVPVAESANVKLAMHPDDPPWDVFGLPRIITNEDSLARFLDLVDSPVNGLTFCTGSLGALAENDLPAMVRRFGDKIFFAHSRNVKRTGEKIFNETAHPSQFGDVNLPEVLRAYHDIGYTGPMRPDHGRNIWGEEGIAGYALYDRALGATYLTGLWEGISVEKSAEKVG